jgi:hypothetical protein
MVKVDPSTLIDYDYSNGPSFSDRAEISVIGQLVSEFVNIKSKSKVIVPIDGSGNLTKVV